MQNFIDTVRMYSTIQNTLAQMQKQYQTGSLRNLRFENFEENYRAYYFIKIGCFHCQVPLYTNHPSYQTDSLCFSAIVTIGALFVVSIQLQRLIRREQRRDYAATSPTPVLNVYSSTFCRQHAALIICV